MAIKNWEKGDNLTNELPQGHLRHNHHFAIDQSTAKLLRSTTNVRTKDRKRSVNKVW
jgi:hypothetical protein